MSADTFSSLVAILDGVREGAVEEGGDMQTLHRVLCDICLSILNNSREISRINGLLGDGYESIRKDIEMKKIVSRACLEKGRGMLTEREKEVLVQLLRGETNREISKELRIDEKTVKNHLWRIYRKMDVNNRTQLLHKIFYE